MIVYTGAYLKMWAEKVPAESPYICPEHSNKKLWEPGFCQRCGKALVRDDLRLKTASVWDLLPDAENEFLQPDMEDKDSLVLLSNGKHTAPDHVYTNELDEIEVTQSMVEGFIKNFKNNHKESIEKLRAATTRLVIKFGVIQYYF